MSPSEIAFLAAGLVIGAAVGAAIMEALRARPAPRRQVRLTISPNSVTARRSSTLADPAAARAAGPIPGSPEDGAYPDPLLATPPATPVPAPTAPATPLANRTRVSSGPVQVPATAVAVPVQGGSVPMGPGRAGSAPVRAPVQGPGDPGRDGSPTATRLATAPGSMAPSASATLAATVAVAVAVAEPASLPAAPATHPSSLDVGRPAPNVAVRTRPPAPLDRPRLVAGDVGVPVSAGPDRPRAAEGPRSGAFPAAAAPVTDPCATPRLLVEERCALADDARARARAAADALREARRGYDMLRERVEQASAIADPREVGAARDELHRRFREVTEAGADAGVTEAAAREWLEALNELNARAEEAARTVAADGEALREALPRLDRLALEADAARIRAETAEAGCLDARERLASCEEALDPGPGPVPPPGPDDTSGASSGSWPDETDATRSDAGPGAGRPTTTDVPLALRLVRGDREARDRLVARLAEGDRSATAAWQLRLAALVDAVAARAIEDGCLDLPEDDPFWGLFERGERREIVRALSALGYRFDGLGGFADGRVPAARDLSLAVGYAGLDRMRIRTWPRDSELASLFERATVAADEWLVDQADDLSLGRMVEALGSRAAGLADVWNAWGRLRPALLAAG